jgi:hypothetical protein
MMVFAAGFGQLTRRVREEYDWVGTLVFGAMAVWLGVSLVANGLKGGSALESLSGSADPSVSRALTMGYLLIYNGSIAFTITGLSWRWRVTPPSSPTCCRAELAG